jgi:Xaa-Pro dipeptidase
MPLHFTPAEYAARQAQARAAVQAAGLDALLMFAPESHYWISGYDTFGFAMFQCMVLTAKGELHLLTRTPDLRQARLTSTLSDSEIHIWQDVEGVNPAASLARLLADLGVSGKVGYESDTVGLTDKTGRALHAAIPGLIDASDLLSGPCGASNPPPRSTCTAAPPRLSDDALWTRRFQLARPGAFEGDILAAMQGAVFKGGGDYAGNEFILGSGPGASALPLLLRPAAPVMPTDQLTLEWSGAYARYHAAMMRTVLVGQASDHHHRMHAAAVEALEACEAAIRPGRPMGDVYDAHARVFDARMACRMPG